MTGHRRRLAIIAVLVSPLLLSACGNSGMVEIYTPTTQPPPFARVTIEGSVALPGVGDTKAAAIIAYRSSHGPFVNIMELMKVAGFGQATFDSLKNLITVSG